MCCVGSSPFNGSGGNCRFGGGPSLQNDFVCRGPAGARVDAPATMTAAWWRSSSKRACERWTPSRSAIWGQMASTGLLTLCLTLLGACERLPSLASDAASEEALPDAADVDASTGCILGCLCFDTPGTCPSFCIEGSRHSPDASAFFVCEEQLGGNCARASGHCVRADAACGSAATAGGTTDDCDSWPSSGDFCCLDEPGQPDEAGACPAGQKTCADINGALFCTFAETCAHEVPR